LIDDRTNGCALPLGRIFVREQCFNIHKGMGGADSVTWSVLSCLLVGKAAGCHHAQAPNTKLRGKVLMQPLEVCGSNLRMVVAC